MKKFIDFICLAVVSAACLAASAQAGVKVELHNREDATEDHEFLRMFHYYTPQALRMDLENDFQKTGDPTWVTIIIRLDKNQLITIDPQKKTYSVDKLDETPLTGDDLTDTMGYFLPVIVRLERTGQTRKFSGFLGRFHRGYDQKGNPYQGTWVFKSNKLSVVREFCRNYEAFARKRKRKAKYNPIPCLGTAMIPTESNGSIRRIAVKLFKNSIFRAPKGYRLTKSSLSIYKTQIQPGIAAFKDHAQEMDKYESSDAPLEEEEYEPAEEEEIEYSEPGNEAPKKTWGREIGKDAIRKGIRGLFGK
ncbi:MAG: hypothetical protein COB53_08055 [Elusimicrobia bacterium]|nr:MAG: hypothetical protein COB53_08055 [Elusimicrobiota bacterium]